MFIGSVQRKILMLTSESYHFNTFIQYVWFKLMYLTFKSHILYKSIKVRYTTLIQYVCDLKVSYINLFT
jgi:hypothetical protein